MYFVGKTDHLETVEGNKENMQLQLPGSGFVMQAVWDGGEGDQQFSSAHVKFEVALKYPSENDKGIAEYMNLKFERRIS